MKSWKISFEEKSLGDLEMKLNKKLEKSLPFSKLTCSE
jgi:hypothetical protein